MEEKGYGYIYKTTNLVNGKIYIGQHKHDKLDNSYIGGGLKLQKAIKKYGKENFKCEHIEECKDYKTLNEREIYWIAFYNSTNKKIGYNIESGGNQSPLSEETKKKLSKKRKGKHLSEETKRKISKATAGKNNPMYGKHFSEEILKKISETSKGRHHSEESRKKMSEKRKGKKFSEEHNKNLSKALKGRIFSEEHRRRISESKKGTIPYNKGKKYSEEIRKKISEACKKRSLNEEWHKKLSEIAKERAKKRKELKNENNNLGS